jgi:hypothetical protein
MSKDDPNNLGHYHDKGEQDYAEDKGNNPPNRQPDFLQLEHERDQNRAYREGRENAAKQDKDK